MGEGIGRGGFTLDSVEASCVGELPGAREGSLRDDGLTLVGGRFTRGLPAMAIRGTVTAGPQASTRVAIFSDFAGTMGAGSAVREESTRVNLGPGTGAATTGSRSGAPVETGLLAPGAAVPWAAMIVGRWWLVVPERARCDLQYVQKGKKGTRA